MQQDDCVHELLSEILIFFFFFFFLKDGQRTANPFYSVLCPFQHVQDYRQAEAEKPPRTRNQNFV